MGQLVEHDGLGAVAPGEGDGRAGVFFAVERLTRALPGPQAGHAAEVAIGESLVPPEGAHDPVDEPGARVEPGERAAREWGLGEVDASTLRVARAPVRS